MGKDRTRKGPLTFALLALLLLPLAACGKKGPLEPPAGEPSTYPKVYPRD